MADKPQNDAERIARILDNLGDYLGNAPGQELLEDARAEGRNPQETTTRVKGILKSAFKDHQQRHLRAAREGYQQEAAAMAQGQFELPRTAQGRRDWFVAAITQLPQLQPAFTLQNRDFTSLSDD